MIQFDYFFLGDEGDEKLVAMAGVDRASGSIFATQSIVKGSGCVYTVAAICSWLRELGYSRMELRSDGEPAILDMINAVKTRMEKNCDYDKVLCQASPRESHQSNGAVERAISTLRGVARVFIQYLSKKTGSTIRPDGSWWVWALRHASWIYNRFQAT